MKAAPKAAIKPFGLAMQDVPEIPGALKPKLYILHLVAMMGILIVPLASKDVLAQGGIASVYSSREGTRTASGVKLNDNALTAAHRTLPFGTKVHVTNTKNG